MANVGDHAQKKFGACISAVNGVCSRLFVFSHACVLDSGWAQRAGVQKRTGARVATPVLGSVMEWKVMRLEML